MGLPVHLRGRGGPPAGLPCGSQIPTYLSLGVRSLRDLDHHVTACSEGVRACGGGGGVLGLLSVRPHFCWGGWGQQKVCSPVSWSPRGTSPRPAPSLCGGRNLGRQREGGGGGGGGVAYPNRGDGPPVRAPQVHRRAHRRRRRGAALSGKSSDRSPLTDLCPHTTCTSCITRQSRDTHCPCIAARRRQAPHPFPSVVRVKVSIRKGRSVGKGGGGGG